MSSPLWRYRGREIWPEDLALIERLMAENPRWSRRRLSAGLCRAWNWVQPNGALRDMVCRSLLLQLHRAGLIELPAKRFSPRNNVVARVEPESTLPLWEAVDGKKPAPTRAFGDSAGSAYGPRVGFCRTDAGASLPALHPAGRRASEGTWSLPVASPSPVWPGRAPRGILSSGTS